MDKIFDRELKYLSGVGERRAALLQKELGLVTLNDLLHLYPYRYIDRTQVYPISAISPETQSYVQIKARVRAVRDVGSGPKRRLSVSVVDAQGGRAELVWFKRVDWVVKKIEQEREYLIFGKPSFYGDMLSFVHPEFDVPMSESALAKMSVYGVYPSTERLNKANCGTKFIAGLVHEMWRIVEPRIEETLPETIRKDFLLVDRKTALRNIHFPQDPELFRKSLYRLKFEEFLTLQLSMLRLKNIRIRRNRGLLFPVLGEKFNLFYREHLPFELTKAQQRVLKEIRRDTLSGRQMNRLLQGDVGSGKTMVAFISMLFAIDNGYQAAIMAPTEILAMQHYEFISEIAAKIGIRAALLTGSTRAKERRQIDEALRSGELNILIGTHALLEDNVAFRSLGLVIIDEQHRFGVEQRSRLWMKNEDLPHVLVMTATPIPRTLAMTIYGDLDVSVIDELPPGRKPIRTLHFTDSRRLQLFAFMREQIAQGRQIYVVYPLVKESEKMDYKSLEDGYESITRAFPHPDYVTVIVHGQMKAADKEFGMNQFKNGEAHIMVATTVIEVGVNVPNASVMVIESAERFGLSQLHQLRGRVGRGASQSYCILMSGDKLGRESRKRLKAMVDTNDGFALAELDLQLRGYGDLEGTLQSGNAFELKLASVGKDSEILYRSRAAAEALLERDPELEAPENRLLREAVASRKTKPEIDFSQIS